MNKMMSSALAIGVGMVAYNYAKKNHMISGRNMKKMQKMVTKMF